MTGLPRRKLKQKVTPQEPACFGALPEGAHFEFVYANVGEKGIVWVREGDCARTLHGRLSQKIDRTVRVRMLPPKVPITPTPMVTGRLSCTESNLSRWVVCNRCSRSVQVVKEPSGATDRPIMQSHLNRGQTPSTCSGAFTTDWRIESEEEQQARLDGSPLLPPEHRFQEPSREQRERAWGWVGGEPSTDLLRELDELVSKARTLLETAAKGFHIQNFFGRDPVEVFSKIRDSAKEAVSQLDSYVDSFCPIAWKGDEQGLVECEGGCGKATSVPCPTHCRDCWKREGGKV